MSSCDALQQMSTTGKSLVWEIDHWKTAVCDAENDEENEREIEPVIFY